MITINGVDFELDLTDADVLERLESAAEKIQKAVDEERNKEQKGSQFVRAFNKLTEDFLDEVIGDGASDELFSGRQNMMEHMKAYQGLFAAKEAAMQEIGALSDNFKNKYSPNRAARRSTGKSNS